MLKDCIEIFKKEYNKPGGRDALITDNYTLDPGDYLLVDKNGQISELMHVDKKDFNFIGFEGFIQKDYLCKLIAMNKPIGNKMIHSNNYLSFWVKKENLLSDLKGNAKLTPEIISHYYEILLTPEKKYKKKKSLETYENLEQDLGKPEEEKLLFCESWIKENIFTLLEKLKLKKDKTYLKIFFKEDLERYQIESQRYYLPNIYNTTDYNIILDDRVFGLPDNNMVMNSKKPYLKNNGRPKNKMPYLLSVEEVYLQKKFFDYLYNYGNQGKTNIYLSSDGIFAYSRDHFPDTQFKGYYLRIQKGKELEIKDYDLITNHSPNLDHAFIIEQVLLLPKDSTSTLAYGNYTKLKEIQGIFNRVFFKKFLTTNYFTDPKDIKLNDFRVKEALLHCRNGFFTWFYKGNTESIKKSFPKVSLTLIKNAIGHGHYTKAIEQFNVREGFITYFKGGAYMANQYRIIEEELRQKLNHPGSHFIKSDLEYYYAVGQLTNYYLSKNKSTKSFHSIVNPVLNCSKDSQLKGLMIRFFKKYNYDITPNRRFNTLQSMILKYIPEGSVDSTPLIAGYLSPNLIYETNKNHPTGGENNDQ